MSELPRFVVSGVVFRRFSIPSLRILTGLKILSISFILSKNTLVACIHHKFVRKAEKTGTKNKMLVGMALKMLVIEPSARTIAR